MHEIVPTLVKAHSVFLNSKEAILIQWVSYSVPKEILLSHGIDREYFLNKYASGVFDYFMRVISGEVKIGNCPVMKELLTYLKTREISAEELFEICSHFRRSMIDFTYDVELNSKDMFDEISYIFDKNFAGILKFYTDTIFQKLVDARQDALQAGQAKEYFLSNMSHEIRTPLNAILGFVNLLLDEEISKKHRNYLDIIHSSGENLLSIINDILDFSKLRSGEFTIEEKTFSLHEEMSHTMELFVASANVKDITISSFIDPQIPVELYGDPLRIKQILSNFLSNAIKFTPELGVIKVNALYRDGELSVNVCDNGIGIAKEDMKNIFTAFTQAEYSTYTNDGGTGLGLSICHQLAQKMGGTVEATSELNKGSCFSIKLPIKPKTQQYQMFEDIEDFRKLKMHVYAKDKEVTYKHESFLKYADIFGMDIEVVDRLDGDFGVCIFIHEDIDDKERSEILRSSKKFVALMSKEYDTYDGQSNVAIMCYPLYCSKIHMVFSELMNPSKNSEYARRISKQYKGHILVAEDNEANKELIKIILDKYGLTYDIASNGLQALELYKLNTYDLILMDEQMPVMNGNEAVEKIIQYEEQKGISHTPISALTANVIKGARERGLLSGFDAFLGKPLVLKELERVFTNYLKVDINPLVIESDESSVQTDNIVGLDVKKLKEELQLTNDELLLLVKLFIKKMQAILPKLSKAIDAKEYKQIAKIAHSIKGSSGNFRLKLVQELSSDMESKAKKEQHDYDYTEAFDILKNNLEVIRVE